MLYCSDSLAYLTAATHGLSDDCDSLAETLQPNLDKVHVTRVKYYTIHICTFTCRCISNQPYMYHIRYMQMGGSHVISL